MKEKTILRMIREKAGLSIFKLSKLSGVSFEKTRQLDMGYRVEGTRREIKEKIADVLGKEVWNVFPDIKEAMVQRDKKRFGEAEEKQRIQFFAEPEIEKGEEFLIMLRGVGRDLKLKEKEKPFFREVITKMTLAEISQKLFGPGITVSEIKKTIESFAKKYDVKSP